MTRTRNYKPIIGQVFDHLTVMEKLPEPTDFGKPKYVCQCDCGVICTRSQSTLYYYRSNKRLLHCGCRKEEATAQQKEARRIARQEAPKEPWDGVMHISAQEFFQRMESMEYILKRKADVDSTAARANKELCTTIDEFLKKVLYRGE